MLNILAILVLFMLRQFTMCGVQKTPFVFLDSGQPQTGT